MPSMELTLVYGAVAGIIGALIMMIIMMIKGDKVTPPMVLAKNMMGDKSKAPMLNIIVFLVWGLIYGILISQGIAAHALETAIGLSIVAWLVMGVVMLPKAGVGMFGKKKYPKWPVMTLVLHLVWGLVLFYTYGALVAIAG